MDYRYLGASGLRVSSIGFGTMGLGGLGKFAQVGTNGVEEARRQLDLCLDAGVDLVDTADIYSDGRSEEIIGEALKGRRDRVVLATKARFAMGERPNDEGSSRHHLIAACEASLRRLGVDYIDLYQVHQWDGRTPLEETLGALETLVQQGKVRYIGCSNFSAWHVMKSLAVSDARHFSRFVSQQIHYTPQAREAENELIPLSMDQGLGILVWSPLAGGLLTGKYRRDLQPSGDARHLSEWNEPPVYDQERLYDIVDTLVEVADARGVSAAQVTLAWLLARPGVTSVIVGARTDEQLADNLAAANLTLTQAELDHIDDASRPPLQYPYWHQANTVASRLSAADLSLIGPHLPKA
jgi:aryl-alcohol dehydrogenase-like predicted oxidoreductase